MKSEICHHRSSLLAGEVLLFAYSYLTGHGCSRELPAFDKRILLDFLGVLILLELHLLTAKMQSSQSSLLKAERISVQTVLRHKKDHHWFSFRVWLAQ